MGGIGRKEGRERSECLSLCHSDSAASAPQLPPHRSTLVLASTQILQLTPGLLIASLFYLYRLGWEWAPEAAGHWCLTVCGFTSQFFQPTRHQCGRSARPFVCLPAFHYPPTRLPGRVTATPLVVLLSHWLALQWAPPPSSQLSMSDRWCVSRPTVCGWRSSGGGEVRGRSGLSPWDPPAHPASGQWVS